VKRKSVSKAPRRRKPAPRWKPYGGLVIGPIPSPHGSSAGVFVARGPSRRYAVMALSTPNGFLGMGTANVLDDHAHAVIAEDVRSLAEAKRLGEAWAKKFRRGLVLSPCACEDMVEAGAPSATGLVRDHGAPYPPGPPPYTKPGVPRGLLPAASPSAADAVRSSRAGASATRHPQERTPSRKDCAVCKAIPGRCVQHDVIERSTTERILASSDFTDYQKQRCGGCGHARIEHSIGGRPCHAGRFSPAPTASCACEGFRRAKRRPKVQALEEPEPLEHDHFTSGELANLQRKDVPPREVER
jgi:hypothetical protein